MRTWEFVVNLLPNQPGPGWWKKKGVPMPREAKRRAARGKKVG
jgi:hypothetical protein